jgi:hypothetical protein
LGWKEHYFALLSCIVYFATLGVDRIGIEKCRAGTGLVANGIPVSSTQCFEEREPGISVVECPATARQPILAPWDKSAIRKPWSRLDKAHGLCRTHGFYSLNPAFYNATL